MRGPLLAALLVTSASASPARPAFDPSAALAPLAETQVPAAPGKPVLAPEDLARAGTRWGNAAQKALLSAAAPGKPFSFAVIGDIEPGRFPWQRAFAPGPEATRKLLRLIHLRRPAFVFQLGDFVSEGDPAHYGEYIRFLDAEVRLPFFTVIGNHDRSRPNGPADKACYKTVFGAGDFFVDHAGWRFIGLDSADRRLVASQLDWLRQALEFDGPKAIFTHVPPDFVKGKLKSCGIRPRFEPPVSSETYWDEVFMGYFEQGAAEFAAAIKGKDVRRVYVAHVHAFGVADIDGTRYVLTGGGGSPLYPLPPGQPQCRFAHFIEASVTPAGLVETAFEPDGSSFPLP